MKKHKLCIIAFLLLLSFTAYILVGKLVPSPHQYEEYIFSGTVIPSENRVGLRPEYVSVRHPVYGQDQICKSTQIDFKKINWLDEENGEFEVNFKVPVGQKHAIITTNCEFCSYKVIDLNNKDSVIEVAWGNNSCEENINFGSKAGIIDYVNLNYDTIESNLVKSQFNESEKESIKDDIKDAKEAIGLSKRKQNEESTLEAYYSLWYYWRAKYKERLFELRYCVLTINDLIETHNSSEGCFVPDYQSYDDYRLSNDTYVQGIDNLVLEDYPQRINDVKKIEGEINSLMRMNDPIQQQASVCSGAAATIKSTFEYQKPYCNARKIALITLNWGQILALIAFGLIIYRPMSEWIEK